MRGVIGGVGAFFVGGLAALCVAGLQGCDRDDKETDKNAHIEDSVDSGREEDLRSEYLPFRLAFRRDGSPVILDERGNAEVWEKAKLPLETKSLYSLQSFSVAFVQGSCTVLVTNIDGSISAKRYPSSYCKAKGIPEN